MVRGPVQAFGRSILASLIRWCCSKKRPIWVGASSRSRLVVGLFDTGGTVLVDTCNR